MIKRKTILTYRIEFLVVPSWVMVSSNIPTDDNDEVIFILELIGKIVSIKEPNRIRSR